MKKIFKRSAIGNIFIFLTCIFSSSIALYAATSTESISASSYHLDSAPACAFDAIISESSHWISDGSVTPETPEWISCDFGKTTPIYKYGIYSLGSEQSPSSWTFEGWDDIECTWVTLDSQSNITDWTAEGKDFTLNTVSNYAKYRLNITGVSSGSGKVCISELILHPFVSPVTADSFYADYCKPDNCFDGIMDSNNYWTSANYVNSSAPAWISYDFKQAKTIKKYTIFTRWSGQAPSEWTLQGWDDIECEWVTLDSQSNITDWSETPSKEFIINTPVNYYGSCFTKYKLNITNTVYGDRVTIEEIVFSEN